MDRVNSDTICNNPEPHSKRLVGRYYLGSLALYKYLRFFHRITEMGLNIFLHRSSLEIVGKELLAGCYGFIHFMDALGSDPKTDLIFYYLFNFFVG